MSKKRFDYLEPEEEPNRITSISLPPSLPPPCSSGSIPTAQTLRTYAARAGTAQCTGVKGREAQGAHESDARGEDSRGSD